MTDDERCIGSNPVERTLELGAMQNLRSLTNELSRPLTLNKMKQDFLVQAPLQSIAIHVGGTGEMSQSGGERFADVLADD